METVIDTVSEVTPSVCEAFARLMPQLSARLGAPSAERLRRICASPAAVRVRRWCVQRLRVPGRRGPTG